MYYVIQVQTSKEDKMIDEIKRHLSDDVLIDVFTPLYTQRKKIKGEWIDVDKPAFPGYIFIETDNIKEVFHQLYYVEGFARLLGREANSENFLPLNKAESKMIEVLYGKENNHTLGISEIKLEQGTKVKVLRGQLFGLEGSIKKVNLHKREVIITFPFGGKSIEARVGIDILDTVE
ncbi:MAG: antiterminator LoaP [Bacilli bacterium]|nr:antiterminator LoaP [Bacilli bacterium]